MSSPEPVLAGSYNYEIVALSILISLLGAYGTLELAAQINAARDWRGRFWLVGGAVASGTTTWSMHYIAMLAFHLPVPIWYDWPTALFSGLPALLAAAVALLAVAPRNWGSIWALPGGIFMGGGIAALHYAAMKSMRLAGMCHYSPPLVALSVLLAILFSLFPLWLMFLAPDKTKGRLCRRAASVLLLGAASPVMHYSGMAAVTFTGSGERPDLSHAVSSSSLGTAGITVVPLMVLGVAILISVRDRLEKSRALLDELFEEAPQAVALINADNRIARVNREFTRLFGYAPQEAVGRSLSELIVPEESQDEVKHYADLLGQRHRLDAETIRRRKDGSRVNIAMVQVPVRVPGGETAVFAIHRDITGQKQLEERLRATGDQLRALSVNLRAAREEERTRIAREIHDELGSALTGLKWGLEELEKMLAEPDTGSPAPAGSEKLRNMMRLTDTTINTVRRIASELRPSILDDLGLAEAIEWQAQQFQAGAGIVCHCDCSLDTVHLNRDQSTTVFRIFQEALTNILRHAQATRVDVTAMEDAGELVLTVRDNGRGIRDNEKWEPSSLGLLGMQERALLVGGKVDIAGSEGVGTVVTVRVPVSP